MTFVQGLAQQYSELVAETFTKQNQLIEELQMNKEEAVKSIEEVQNMNSEFERRF